MGKHGLGTMNDNGERLLSFCMEHKLVIGGTIFTHKKIHTATWKLPDQTTLHQIDHICVSKKFRRSLLDVKVQRGADFNSDHYLLTFMVQLKLKRIEKHQNSRLKYDNNALQNPDKKAEFKLNIKNKYEALAQTNEDATDEVNAKKYWKTEKYLQ